MPRIRNNRWEIFADEINPDEWERIADERDISLMDLNPADKRRVAEAVRKSKDFSIEEKLILFRMLGEPLSMAMVGELLGISDTTVQKTEERAFMKIRQALGVKDNNIDAAHDALRAARSAAGLRSRRDGFQKRGPRI
jgi:DNA-directed RNA polymerase specialized sigma subunit